MKITLCASIAFYNEMLEVKNDLECLNHAVKLPPSEVKNENGDMIPVKQFYSRRKAEKDDTSWIWDRRREAVRAHFKKVEWCDAVLILNYDKNDIANYIGPNTFLEMGLAFYLHKKIFLLNNIPQTNFKEEILSMKPAIINRDLTKIR